MATVTSLILAASPFLTLMLAAGVVGRGAERAAAHAGLSRAAIGELTTAILVVALAFARLFAVAPAWRGITANPLDVLRFTGSGQLSPLGGAVGAGLGLLVLTRRRGLPLLATADVYGLALPLGVAVYNGACLIRGDCYGRVGPAPFGIVFPGLSLPHYPVGLYAAALALFVSAGMARFGQRQTASGFVALLAVTALAAAHALLAPLRLEGASGLLDKQAALVVAVVLVAILVAQLSWLTRVHRFRIAGPIEHASHPREADH
jgi:prolipoprotein diacylglyceryltransferase